MFDRVALVRSFIERKNSWGNSHSPDHDTTRGDAWISCGIMSLFLQPLHSFFLCSVPVPSSILHFPILSVSILYWTIESLSPTSPDSFYLQTEDTTSWFNKWRFTYKRIIYTYIYIYEEKEKERNKRRKSGRDWFGETLMIFISVLNQYFKTFLFTMNLFLYFLFLCIGLK